MIKSQQRIITVADFYFLATLFSVRGRTVRDMHRRWLSFYWDDYSKEAHAGVTQMYVDDVRFTEYYDAHQAGTAKFATPLQRGLIRRLSP